MNERKIVTCCLLFMIILGFAAIIQLTMFRNEKSLFVNENFTIVGSYKNTLPKYSTKNVVKLRRDSNKDEFVVYLQDDCKPYPDNKTIDLTVRVDSQQILFWRVNSYYLPFGTICMPKRT